MFAALDRTLAAWVEQVAPTAPSPISWLMPQTYFTRERRRAFLRSLAPLTNAWGPVLDVGCGLGAMALECAVLLGGPVTGLDRDPEMLRLARALEQAAELKSAPLRWISGDAHALPFPNHTFGSAFARFLLQHLPEPAAVVREIRRVLRPGGLIVLMDADDGLTLEEPPPPPPWHRLQEAFARLQQLRGGNRQIGRRLPGLLQSQGFAVRHVFFDLNTGWQQRRPDDPAWRFERQRLEDSLPDLIAAGLTTADAFREALALRETQLAAHPWMLETAAVCIAVGAAPLS